MHLCNEKAASENQHLKQFCVVKPDCPSLIPTLNSLRARDFLRGRSAHGRLSSIHVWPSALWHFQSLSRLWRHIRVFRALFNRASRLWELSYLQQRRGRRSSVHRDTHICSLLKTLTALCTETISQLIGLQNDRKLKKLTTVLTSSFVNVKIDHCKINLLGLWAVGWTKQDLWRRFLGLLELVKDIFNISGLLFRLND